MDKTLKYQQIISELLESYAQEWSEGSPLQFEVVFDTQRHRYQLVCLGWINDDYIHHTSIHLDIIEEKVWVQKNMTEEFIAETLVARGVLKSDIVLGLQPPDYRKYTEYAVA